MEHVRLLSSISRSHNVYIVFLNRNIDRFPLILCNQIQLINFICQRRDRSQFHPRHDPGREVQTPSICDRIMKSTNIR